MKIGSLAKMGVHFASTAHVSAYRLFGGRVAMGERTLLLTTRGRKTGKENTKPLFYVEDGGCLYIVASYGGNDTPPAWYLNLTANPEVTVEVGSSKRIYLARSMTARRGREDLAEAAQDVSGVRGLSKADNSRDPGGGVEGEGRVTPHFARSS